MIESRCQTCGHPQTHHLSDGYKGIVTIKKYGEHWCKRCCNDGNFSRDSFHTFKLDNLSYIEEFAKERGLV